MRVDELTYEEAWDKHANCVLVTSNLTRKEKLIAERSFINGVLVGAHPSSTLYKETMAHVVNNVEKFSELNDEARSRST